MDNTVRTPEQPRRCPPSCAWDDFRSAQVVTWATANGWFNPISSKGSVETVTQFAHSRRWRIVSRAAHFAPALQPGRPPKSSCNQCASAGGKTTTSINNRSCSRKRSPRPPDRCRPAPPQCSQDPGMARHGLSNVLTAAPPPSRPSPPRGSARSFHSSRRYAASESRGIAASSNMRDLIAELRAEF